MLGLYINETHEGWGRKINTLNHCIGDNLEVRCFASRRIFFEAISALGQGWVFEGRLQNVGLFEVMGSQSST